MIIVVPPSHKRFQRFDGYRDGSGRYHSERVPPGPRKVETSSVFRSEFSVESILEERKDTVRQRVVAEFCRRVFLQVVEDVSAHAFGVSEDPAARFDKAGKESFGVLASVQSGSEFCSEIIQKVLVVAFAVFYPDRRIPLESVFDLCLFPRGYQESYPRDHSSGVSADEIHKFIRLRLVESVDEYHHFRVVAVDRELPERVEDEIRKSVLSASDLKIGVAQQSDKICAVFRYPHGEFVGEPHYYAVGAAVLVAPVVAEKRSRHFRIVVLEVRREHRLSGTRFSVYHHDALAVPVAQPTFYALSQPRSSHHLLSEEHADSRRIALDPGQTEFFPQFDEFAVIPPYLVAVEHSYDIVRLIRYVLIVFFLAFVPVDLVIAHVRPLIFGDHRGRRKLFYGFEKDGLYHTVLGSDRDRKFVQTYSARSCGVSGEKRENAL